jgi:uncharacterized membrane protein
MKTKSMVFFKTGAWILLLAGFVHAAIALTDTFLEGAFSPVSGEAITVLKNTSLNITDWLWGGNTAVFESAWGAYIGFAIGVGLLIGFTGLLLVFLSGRENEVDNRILAVSLAMSAVMTAVAALFYFWFPLAILTASLACFIIAWFTGRKGESYAAR